MPTDDQSARAWAIVQEIAADDDPMISDDMGGAGCFYCGAWDLPEPVEHSDSCPWLRAKQLMNETNP